MIDDYIYIAIIVGIQIIVLIATIVWLYKDGGIFRVINFMVAVALVCAVAIYVTR